MKARENRAMLKGLRHESVPFLFERQIHADADRSGEFGPRGSSFVRCLHQTWTAAGDDVATHFCERGSCSLRFLISECSGPGPRGSEDAHAIAFTPTGLQP